MYRDREGGYRFRYTCPANLSLQFIELYLNMCLPLIPLYIENLPQFVKVKP